MGDPVPAGELGGYEVGGGFPAASFTPVVFSQGVWQGHSFQDADEGGLVRFQFHQGVVARLRDRVFPEPAALLEGGCELRRCGARSAGNCEVGQLYGKEGYGQGCGADGDDGNGHRVLASALLFSHSAPASVLFCSSFLLVALRSEGAALPSTASMTGSFRHTMGRSGNPFSNRRYGFQAADAYLFAQLNGIPANPDPSILGLGFRLSVSASHWCGILSSILGR